MEKGSLIALLALLVLVVASCTTSNRSFELPIMGHTEYIESIVDGQTITDTIYHTIADFKFVDQDSSLVTNQTFEGQVYVADFFFTSCPTICPVMKKEMLRVYNAYEKNPEVAILSHTIDPKHDTVAVLREFAQRLGVVSSKWHFVTGDPDELYDLGEKSYMVVASEDESAPGGYLHSGAFLLVDKQRRIRGVYDGTISEQVDLLINDIQRLINQK